MRRPFSAIEIPARSAKPRDAGLTMMVDWGVPIRAQEDLLALSSGFIDLAKVAVGISGLVLKDTLMQKIACYHDAQVEPFPGGMFLELAYQQGKVHEYYQECRRVGYHLVEVSDNVVRLPRDVRDSLIRQAVEEYGLRVLGEVGSKHVGTDPEILIGEIRTSLAAGAWKVFVEAAEFVSEDGLNTSLVEMILEQIEPAEIIFELPGRWIADVHAHQIYRMMIWLVEHVGSGVNIGNVAVEEVVALETLRTGVGVNMKP